MLLPHRRYWRVFLAVVLVVACLVLWILYSVRTLTSESQLKFINVSPCSWCCWPAAVLASIASDYFLEQFIHYQHHFFALANENTAVDARRKLERLPKFSWNVTQMLHHLDCFVIEIMEYHVEDLLPTTGGSSFLAIAQGRDHVFSCAVKDHFNGTYHVTCQQVQDCLHVKVDVKYYNFQAYAGLSLKWEDKTVVAVHLCFNQPHLLGKPYTGWKRSSLSNGRLQWHDGNSFQRKLDDNDIRLCLQHKVQNLVIVGNSHMRIAYQYLMNATGHINATNYTPRITETTTFAGKYTFSWHRTGYQLAKFLHLQNVDSWAELIPPNLPNPTHEQEKLTSSKKNVVVMSTGSLDMRTDGVTHFCDVVVPLLSRVIARTKQIMKDKLTLIYVTQPPIAEVFTAATGRRNNVAIGATNAAIIGALRQIDVIVIDGYSMQLPRFREGVDPIHYAGARLVNNSKTTGSLTSHVQFFGDVGLAVIDATLNTFC